MNVVDKVLLVRRQKGYGINNQNNAGERRGIMRCSESVGRAKQAMQTQQMRRSKSHLVVEHTDFVVSTLSTWVRVAAGILVV